VSLDRPTGLEAGTWAAIDSQAERLRHALLAGDRPLVIGTAKDLVEATSRVVLDAHGRPAASGDDFDKVLSAAMQHLNSRPDPVWQIDWRIDLRNNQALVMHCDAIT
jgi:hypothetical protein